MKFMLDTNVVIAVALASGEHIRARMAEHDEGDFVMSVISYAEAVHGSRRGKPPALDRLEILVQEVPVLPFDEPAARTYGLLSFRRSSYDRLIGAHALSIGAMVITNNEIDFADVPGLKVENWTI
ncbi:MAG TPA: type II toxin-antitoxin system VapC family toxin [Novosphingobium sp.]|nr:type II toxin-antitoxin system VapC family toxin [Novosphingobium sp.]